MPTPFHCIECDKPFLKKGADFNPICDNCLNSLSEPTTADRHNKRYITSIVEHSETMLEINPDKKKRRK